MRARANRSLFGSTYPAWMKPRVFFSQRQGLAGSTSPHLSFMKLCRSRRARARRWRKLSRLISSSSAPTRSEEHTSELQSRSDLVCRLLLEKKNSGVVFLRVDLGRAGDLEQRLV